jgi:hypothetical protein
LARRSRNRPWALRATEEVRRYFCAPGTLGAPRTIRHPMPERRENGRLAGPSASRAKLTEGWGPTVLAIFVLVGIVHLLREASGFSVGRLWPLVGMAVGAMVLVRSVRLADPGGESVAMGGAAFAMMSAYVLCGDLLRRTDYGNRVWPLATLVAFGLGQAVYGTIRNEPPARLRGAVLGGIGTLIFMLLAATIPWRGWEQPIVLAGPVLLASGGLLVFSVLIRLQNRGSKGAPPPSS